MLQETRSSKSVPIDDRDNLTEHPAIQAWLTIRPSGPVPQQVTSLKSRPGKEPAVYRLDGIGPRGSNVIAKQCRSWSGRIERLIYQEILPSAEITAPSIYGYLEEPEGSYSWLFIESVEGLRYCSDIGSHRVLVAEWLAALQTRTQHLAVAHNLPARNAAYYLDHLQQARRKIRNNMGNDALSDEYRAMLQEILVNLDWVEFRWSLIEAATQMMPATLVHGDFVGKNLCIRQTESQLCLVVFDWEWAGWGYPGVDLISVSDLDADTYWSIVKKQWSKLDLDSIRELAPISHVMRCIAAVHWASYSLGSQWLRRPMRKMRFYEEQLARLIESGRVA